MKTKTLNIISYINLYNETKSNTALSKTGHCNHGRKNNKKDEEIPDKNRIVEKASKENNVSDVLPDNRLPAGNRKSGNQGQADNLGMGSRRSKKIPCKKPFDSKIIHVAFADEKLKKAFERLRTGRHESRDLFKSINKAFDALKEDPFCGIQIQKKLIPKEYNASNLWKYNLPKAWRLLYTVKEDQITILSIVLEWVNHKEYEKRFKY